MPRIKKFGLRKRYSRKNRNVSGTSVISKEFERSTPSSASGSKLLFSKCDDKELGEPGVFQRSVKKEIDIDEHELESLDEVFVKMENVEEPQEEGYPAVDSEGFALGSRMHKRGACFLGLRSPPASDKELAESPITSGSEELSDWTTSDDDWNETGSPSPLRPSTSRSPSQLVHHPGRSVCLERSAESANGENRSDEKPGKERPKSDRTGKVPESSSRPTDDLHPSVHPLYEANADDRSRLNANSSVLDFFLHYFSEDLVQFVAEQTNNFYQFVVQLDVHSSSSLLRTWQDTTMEEMFCFLAVCMLMPRTEKLFLHEYWSKDSLISTPAFGEMMSQDRFTLLLHMLHFSDNRITQRRDKIGKIVDIVRQNFQRASLLFQTLCTGDSHFVFEGRLLLKQYIPPERSSCGIKIFVLCDCWTGYVLDFILYRRGPNNVENNGITDDIVGTFLQPFLEKGHTIYIENRVTSPALFTWLLVIATEVCGSTKTLRKDMSQMEAKLKTGETVFQASNLLMVLKWCDKREMWMLSLHNSTDLAITKKSDRTTKERKMKPQCIVEYNQNTVDCRDVIPSLIESIRKAVKWYKRFFFHLLDLSIFNGHALFKIVTGKNVSIAQYHVALIREVVEKYGVGVKQGGGKSQTEKIPLRLKHRPFPTVVPSEGLKSKSPQRRCVVCSRNHVTKKSRYMCKECNVGLCISPCFKIYHTQENF